MDCLLPCTLRTAHKFRKDQTDLPCDTGQPSHKRKQSGYTAPNPASIKRKPSHDSRQNTSISVASRGRGSPAASRSGSISKQRIKSVVRNSKVGEKLGKLAMVCDVANIPQPEVGSVLHLPSDEFHSRDSYVEMALEVLNFAKTSLEKGERPVLSTPPRTHSGVVQRYENVFEMIPESTNRAITAPALLVQPDHDPIRYPNLISRADDGQEGQRIILSHHPDKLSKDERAALKARIIRDAPDDVIEVIEESRAAPASVKTYTGMRDELLLDRNTFKQRTTSQSKIPKPMPIPNFSHLHLPSQGTRDISVDHKSQTHDGVVGARPCRPPVSKCFSIHADFDKPLPTSPSRAPQPQSRLLTQRHPTSLRPGVTTANGIPRKAQQGPQIPDHIPRSHGSLRNQVEKAGQEKLKEGAGAIYKTFRSSRSNSSRNPKPTLIEKIDALDQKQGKSTSSNYTYIPYSKPVEVPTAAANAPLGSSQAAHSKESATFTGKLIHSGTVRRVPNAGNLRSLHNNIHDTKTSHTIARPTGASKGSTTGSNDPKFPILGYRVPTGTVKLVENSHIPQPAATYPPYVAKPDFQNFLGRVKAVPQSPTPQKESVNKVMSRGREFPRATYKRFVDQAWTEQRPVVPVKHQSGGGTGAS